jgi:hypothetical protein
MKKSPQKYKGKELSERKAINNVLRYFELATSQEMSEGIEWYNAANSYCRELAERFNSTPQQCAGIIAAFSPQTDWASNKRFAVSFLLSPNARVKSLDQTLKAKAILKTTNESEIYSRLSTVDKAFKTRAFFLNLMNPDIETTVTIDRHAISAVLQLPNEVRSIGDDYTLPTKIQYAFFVSVYTKAAKQANVLPHQAIIWTVYRRLRSLKEHSTENEFKPFINPDYDF